MARPAVNGSGQGRRILVTGASGFVGRHLVAHLKSIGDIPIAWGQGEGAIDIRDAEAVNDGMRVARADAVIHLAAIAAPAQARANPREAWDVNLNGTLNLAQATFVHAPEAAFVFVGSSECYGLAFNGSAQPLSEDAPLQPATPYGATKAAADIMIGQMARDGLRALRMRPFNHTGPGQEPTYVVSDFARQIALLEKQGGGTVRVGNLNVRRDFLAVRDVVDAYARAAHLPSERLRGEAVNISTGCPVSVRDVLDELVAAAQAPVRVDVDEARVRPQEIAAASGDRSRAKALLGWEPQIPFSQTLAEVLDFWRRQV
jgi:GDP-4-dehydro-6-deoxy-D-mannose reductase